MKFAKIFKVFKNENFGKNNFIWLEEFIQFLKSKDENINVYNIKRTLNGLQTLDNKIGVPVGGIIKYVFKNRETYISCKLICEVIEEQISETTDSSYSQSSFELYKKIAKTKFFNSEYQLEDIKFEENHGQIVFIKMCGSLKQKYICDNVVILCKTIAIKRASLCVYMYII